MFKKYLTIPNILCLLRIMISIFLIPLNIYSRIFIILYLISGISDILDGYIARKTNNVTDFGSKLDTVADIVLFSVIIIKLLPLINSYLIIVWFGLVLGIKIISIIYGYLNNKELVSIHSNLNRITGAMLFMMPLSLKHIDIRISSFIVLMLASIASIQELYFLVRNRV